MGRSVLTKSLGFVRSVFPPKDNADVRIKEVKAIRNRVAHFREPHPQDIARLELFMRDMEPGIRCFCSRYTVARIPRDCTEDTVSAFLERDWDRIGYGIELNRPHGWLYAPEPNRARPLMNARFEMLFHVKSTSGSDKGTVYRLTIVPGSRNGWTIDVIGFFECTKALHRDIIHFVLSPFGEVSVTIPAIHGTEKVAALVTAFLQSALEATRRAPLGDLSRKKHEWPEYVLWPDHILTFFSESSDNIHEPILEI